MTSRDTSLIPNLPGTDHFRPPLRLQLSGSPGRGAIDGGWWPYSRNIDIELADLIDGFPAVIGRVDRVLYSRPDWDRQPRSVRVARGRIKTGSFPRDNTHVIVLAMSTQTRLMLLVVPPDHPQGMQAMALAGDASNRSSATEILAALRFDAEVSEGHDQWTDDGGNWWREDAGPPSFRTGPPR
jgi:hypothetical protein